MNLESTNLLPSPFFMKSVLSTLSPSHLLPLLILSLRWLILYKNHIKTLMKQSPKKPKNQVWKSACFCLCLSCRKSVNSETRGFHIPGLYLTTSWINMILENYFVIFRGNLSLFLSWKIFFYFYVSRFLVVRLVYKFLLSWKEKRFSGGVFEDFNFQTCAQYYTQIKMCRVEFS